MQFGFDDLYTNGASDPISVHKLTDRLDTMVLILDGYFVIDTGAATGFQSGGGARFLEQNCFQEL